MINAPSSTQKRLVERYSRNGDTLRLDLVAEDPIFLLGPTAPLITRATNEPLALPWNCDPASAQRNLHVVKSKPARSADQSEELTMKAGAFIGALLLRCRHADCPPRAGGIFDESHRRIEGHRQGVALYQSASDPGARSAR